MSRSGPIRSSGSDISCSVPGPHEYRYRSLSCIGELSWGTGVCSPCGSPSVICIAVIIGGDVGSWLRVCEPGPCKVLAEHTDEALIASLKTRLDVSVKKHGSRLVFISGHYDCARNPGDQETQEAQVFESMKWVKQEYSEVEIVGLWIDENWQVSILDSTPVEKTC